MMICIFLDQLIQKQLVNYHRLAKILMRTVQGSSKVFLIDSIFALSTTNRAFPLSSTIFTLLFSNTNEIDLLLAVSITLTPVWLTFSFERGFIVISPFIMVSETDYVQAPQTYIGLFRFKKVSTMVFRQRLTVLFFGYRTFYPFQNQQGLNRCLFEPCNSFKVQIFQNNDSGFCAGGSLIVNLTIYFSRTSFFTSYLSDQRLSACVFSSSFTLIDSSLPVCSIVLSELSSRMVGNQGLTKGQFSLFSVETSIAAAGLTAEGVSATLIKSLVLLRFGFQSTSSESISLVSCQRCSTLEGWAYEALIMSMLTEKPLSLDASSASSRKGSCMI